MPWEHLYEGKIITKELWKRLYGALWKLMEYEDTGLTPEEAEALEKQTKKVALRICGAMGEKYECPECGSGLRDADLFAGHCKWCGQAIREN